MKKYKKISNKKIAVIISDKAAGMGEKTIGTSYVIYKYEEDNLDFPFVMTNKEFYNTHSEIK